MFVHSGKLPHLLPPAAYFEQEWFNREMQSIFLPGWNVFCPAEELARDGDMVAREVLGVPIVVINRKGTLYALKNVCAHRHAKMMSDGKCNAPTLKCQIHGWEYDETGRLARITDGRSFRGFRASDLCLQRFRAEKAGPVVMVSMQAEGPRFQEHLGSFAPEYERYFGQVRLFQHWSIEVEANWKIIMENAVESYHVPMIHPRTFKDFRDESLHDHRLEPTYSRYEDLLKYEQEQGWRSKVFEYYTRMLIRNPTFQRFTHVAVYPNILLYFKDIFAAFNFVEPLAADRTRVTFFSCVPTGLNYGWVGQMIQTVFMKAFLSMARKVVFEDVYRWPPVHKGLRQSSFRGILSCREERVWAFQKYVAEQVGYRPADPEPDSAAQAEVAERSIPAMAGGS